MWAAKDLGRVFDEEKGMEMKMREEELKMRKEKEKMRKEKEKTRKKKKTRKEKTGCLVDFVTLDFVALDFACSFGFASSGCWSFASSCSGFDSASASAYHLFPLPRPFPYPPCGFRPCLVA